MRFRKKRKSTYDKYYSGKRVSWVIIFAAVGAVILIAAGVLVFVSLYRNYNYVEEDVSYTRVNGSASLPVVMINFESDQINQLYGYIGEMDIKSMRDTICVLEDTYSLIITAQTKETTVKKVSFRLYDLSVETLIQESDDVEFVVSDDKTSLVAELKFDNIISENTEYNLVITLTDKKGNDIHYYTRIIRESSVPLAEELEFVRYFHDLAYSVSEDDEKIINSYLETDYRYEDNKNLCHVYLLSNYYHMTWGDLNVTEMAAPVVNLIDVNDEILSFRLDYMVASDYDTDTPEYIAVSEFFRVRYVEEKISLLAYDRTAETIFTPSADTVATKSADLGILSEDKNVEIMSSADGNITCFSAGGSLWQMNAEEKRIRAIFSFLTDVNDVSDSRERRNQHDIRIIQVTNDGNVEFMVYGYMNRGFHEGQCGLAVYMYSAEDDEVREEVFMQSSFPYYVMENAFGDLCYLSSKDSLYVMIDECVYSFDISSGEAERITDNLNDGNYMLSTSGKMLAWQQGGLINSAEEITVLDMETEETYTVKAEDGCSIKVLGFLGSDLVYGSGEVGNYYTDLNGSELLLMDEIFISGKSGIQAYDKAEKDIYYTGSDDQFNRVIVNCVNASKNYAEVSDVTIYAAQSETLEPASTYTEYLEFRETVTYVEFVERASSVKELIIDTSTPVYMLDSDSSSLEDFLSVTGKYYVYALGRLSNVTSSAAEAVIDAYDGGGVVIYEGVYFYRRGLRPSSSTISEEDISKAVTSYEEESCTDVTGITLGEAMYYLGIKTPLIWEYQSEVYVIYGYTVTDSLLLYNISSGEMSSLDYNTAEDLFEESGRCYVVR